MTMSYVSDARSNPAEKTAAMLITFSPDQVSFLVNAVTNNASGVMETYKILREKSGKFLSPFHLLPLSAPNLSVDDVFHINLGLNVIQAGAHKQEMNYDYYLKLLLGMGVTSDYAKKYAKEIDTKEQIKLSSKVTNFFKKAVNLLSFGWNPFNTIQKDPDILYEISTLGKVVVEIAKHLSLTTSAITSLSAGLAAQQVVNGAIGDVIPPFDGDIFGDVYQANVPELGDVPELVSDAAIYIPAHKIERLIGDLSSAIEAGGAFERNPAQVRHFLSPVSASVLKTYFLRSSKDPKFMAGIARVTQENAKARQQWVNDYNLSNDQSEKRGIASKMRCYDMMASVSSAPYLKNLEIGDLD